MDHFSPLFGAPVGITSFASFFHNSGQHHDYPDLMGKYHLPKILSCLLKWCLGAQEPSLNVVTVYMAGIDKVASSVFRWQDHLIAVEDGCVPISAF
ncbi:unnamed protein product [Euphydryas editha]|uniref:Uncharacterized protein n=1 Tax=Euphydryas editha TaxID=104508 RepID=A0AAU9UA49_EUPED|nr:unnamed protein product [Euphydryas editha]